MAESGGTAEDPSEPEHMAGTRPQANYRPSCATYPGTLYQMDLGRGRGGRCGEIAVAPVIFLIGGWRSEFGGAADPSAAPAAGKGGDPSVTANAEEPHWGTGPAGEWRPIPDPTKLTTEQLRREVATLREILETRLDGMDRATALATELASVHVTGVRKEIEQIRGRLREEAATQVEQLRELLETRLDGMGRAIALQFTERDVRADQAAETAPQALGSAMSAQKELVEQQNDANSAATAKAEASFTKQIDQIGMIIQTMEKATDARITELKERIDRGEGLTTGAAGSRSERAQVTGQILMMLSVLAAVIGLLILAFRH